MIVTKHKHLGIPPPVNEQISRVGRALPVLWDHFNAWRYITNSRSGTMRRVALKMKTKALIKHDRILRGEV